MERKETSSFKYKRRIDVEKGFDEYTAMVYNQNGSFMSNGAIEDTYQTFYSAPTLQMTTKWLREVHDLHIMVNCVGKVNYDPIIQRFDGKDFEIEGVEIGITRRINGNWEDVRRGFKTHEQACEAAIKYCLENLI